MLCKIKSLKLQHDETLIVYFDYFGKERFTYLSPKSVKYWNNKLNIDIQEGVYINVITTKYKGQNRFKIIHVQNGI